MASKNTFDSTVLAVDCTRLAAVRTGIENYIHNLLPHLTQTWIEGGGQVVIYAQDPSFVEHAARGVAQEARDRVVVRAGGGSGWTQFRLAAACRRDGVSVLFNPIPILPLYRRLPCPAVVTVHDLHEFRRGRWWYTRRLLSRTLARAAGIVCVSDSTRMEVVGEFAGLDGRCTVVHEGVDMGVFHPPTGEGSSDRILARVGVVERPYLAVGTIQPRKNYARLIRAYGRLPPGAPPLVIVGGEGWEHAEILRLPGELGLENRVLFAGHVAESELADLMRGALALCAVSSAEGFGLPLVEAMATGLPILAADIPPFREVAGTAAIFADPLDEASIADGLARLAADSGLRDRLSEAGLGRRGLFSWEIAGRAVAGILRAAV